MTKWTDTVIFKKFSKSNGNNFSNNNRATSIFELYLHLFIIPLYTKHHLNPSNHHWENEQKLSFSISFLSPRAITSPTIIGQHPYSNLTCIFSWYIWLLDGKFTVSVIFSWQLLLITVLVLSVLIITVVYCHFYCQCCDLLSFTVLILSLLRITVIYCPYRSPRASPGIAPQAEYTR